MTSVYTKELVTNTSNSSSILKLLQNNEAFLHVLQLYLGQNSFEKMVLSDLCLVGRHFLLVGPLETFCLDLDLEVLQYPAPISIYQKTKSMIINFKFT